jgi:hypothetical protein
MTFGPGCAGLQNLYHQESLRRSLIALLMAPGTSNGNSLAVIIFLPFCCRLWDLN